MRILEHNEVGYGILVEQDAGYISKDIRNNDKLLKEALESRTADHFIFYAILQKAGVENRNGRVYSYKILDRENNKYQSVIQKRASLSELNHPDSSIIDLDKTSHLILETFWDGNTLMGKIQLLVSPGFIKMGVVSTKGDTAANLLSYGVTLGISSRGVGSLKKEGDKNVVQDDFELVCFDLVSSPSTPGAYLFKDLSDKDKYDEVLVPEKEKPQQEEEYNGSKRLMTKLDSFLKKY